MGDRELKGRVTRSIEYLKLSQLAAVNVQM